MNDTSSFLIADRPPDRGHAAEVHASRYEDEWAIGLYHKGDLEGT